MKTTHRKIPNDLFSVEEGRHRINIFRHKQWVILDIWRDETHSQQRQFTFDQFRRVLEALPEQYPLSPPSPDGKEAATALHSTEKGVL